ncbi:transcription factor IIIA-like isoform X1 [Petromyzon marinus]|uniref:Transcription factor IIIA n=1 Tax=Petromyzon marinus TaxID=7757 RepID=A0AAJ7T6U5_PETMA|nr:transcription factor IIIA-like isoform X1 [Petromyzon marinus]
MSVAASVRGKLYLCSHEGCSATFSKEWRLMEHLYRHEGLDSIGFPNGSDGPRHENMEFLLLARMPFVCDYEGCTKGFTRKFHLSRHRLTHSGDRPYRCVFEGCCEGFTTNANLKKHVKRKHEKENPSYKCEFDSCGKVFKKHQQLKTHQYEHTKELPFECPHSGCEQKFLQARQLKRHEKTHLGYTCKREGCDFVAKTWSEVRSHAAQQHPGCHVCNECGRTFKRRAFLHEHEQTHAESREVFACPNPGCERTYTTAFNLRSHLISFHENVRPHSCPYPGCGRKFAMKQSLDRHGVMHDPEKKKLKKKRSCRRRTLVSRLSGIRHTAVVSEAVLEMEACDGELPEILFGKASIGSPPPCCSPETAGLRCGSRDPTEERCGETNAAARSPDAPSAPGVDGGAAIVPDEGNETALTSEIDTVEADSGLQRNSVIKMCSRDERGGPIPIGCKVDRLQISPIEDQIDNEASM